MHTASLRKVGGSVMLAIPRPILDQLKVGPGRTVGLTVEDGRVVVEPHPRPRYTLDALLAEGGDPVAPMSDEDRSWFAASSAGREVI